MGRNNIITYYSECPVRPVHKGKGCPVRQHHPLGLARWSRCVKDISQMIGSKLLWYGRFICGLCGNIIFEIHGDSGNCQTVFFSGFINYKYMLQVIWLLCYGNDLPDFRWRDDKVFKGTVIHYKSLPCRGCHGIKWNITCPAFQDTEYSNNRVDGLVDVYSYTFSGPGSFVDEKWGQTAAGLV